MSAPKATREYIVLERSTVMGDPEDTWREVGTYTAHDDDAAVRYHIDQSRAESGTYRAIARSAWEPLLRVKVVKTTKLTLEHGEAGKRRRPSSRVAKPETEPEGQFDGDGMEREATPDGVDLMAATDPLMDGLAAALEGAPA